MRGFMGPGSRCARPGASRGLGRVVDRVRDGAPQGRHPLEQPFDRKGPGQVAQHPVFLRLDLGGDFAEGEDDGRGVRLGEGGLQQGVCA